MPELLFPVELAFPVAGALVLVLVAIPVATLLCKAALMLLQRLRPDPQLAGSTGRYLLVVFPVIIPVGWLASAAAHHAEEGRAALACLLDHVTDESCAEPLILLLALLGAIAIVVLRGYHVATRHVAKRQRHEDSALAGRIDRLALLHPAIARARHRMTMVHGDDLRTVGLIAARVEIGHLAAARLDDAALAAALHHELEHVNGRDPLRIVLAGICQTLNPLAFLLAPEVTRWRAGRELGCDAAAVHRGADPLALADALVKLSRPHAEPSLREAHLGRGGGIALIRLRVSILLDPLMPARCRPSQSAASTAAALIVAAAVLPHLLDAWPLGDVHHHTESLLLTHASRP